MATRRTNYTGPAQADAARINALVNSAMAAVEAGDHPSAIASFEQLLAIDPDNSEILSNLGVLYYNTGDKERAVTMFAKAHARAPQNEGILKNCVTAHVGAAEDRIARGSYEQAIAWIRKALEYDPTFIGARVSLANALEFSGQHATLTDFLPGGTPERLGQHILVACMPKSGSTFLKATLCTLTGWNEAHYAYAYLQNEQEIYLPNVLQVAFENTVTQQHCRATGPNLQILQAFEIRPIVLVRHLADIVLSLSDFYDQGAISNTFFGDAWPSLDQQGKYDLIIDHVMPWYAGFYASWERAQRRSQIDCMFVTYGEMLADKPATIARISAFLGLGKTAEECAAAVRRVDGDVTKTRFNKGVTGRGAEALSDDQKARLRRLASSYGPVDLERVGLAD